MGISGNEWGFQVGKLPKGALDKISDVPGVTVGHCTLADGVVQTGVTALLPMTLLHDDAINPLFRAVAECVEESVLSSLLHAETVTGSHGRTFRSLTELLRRDV